jgi:hypothetical protein
MSPELIHAFTELARRLGATEITVCGTEHQNLTTEETMDEKSICANIEKMVQQLNGELKAAQELGLKIYIGGLDPMFRMGPPEINVRVWREITMAQSPRRGLDAYGPEASSGRGKVTTETKK